MSAELLTTFLQQKYSSVNGLPFTITNVTINVPGDELANDVTVYLDKESATTVEALSEAQLLALGHDLLEGAFLQMAAPSRCSLHLAYQFFAPDVANYEGDESYFVGDWWESEVGYWVVRTYLNFYYDEQAAEVLAYNSWFSPWLRNYRPERSKLLYFAGAAEFEQFWDEIVQAPKFAELPIEAVFMDEVAPGYKLCQIEVTPQGAAQLQENEYMTLVLGCRFFVYALRFYRDTVRKIQVKITAAGNELVYFERRSRTYWYQSWLDDEPVRLQLTQPLVFNGRAKRALKAYLQQQFTFRRFRLEVAGVKLPEEKIRSAIITVTVPRPYLFQWSADKLLETAAKLIWDVFAYYGRPPRCVLRIQEKNLQWHVAVRLEQLETGYRLIRRSNLKSYETIYIDKDKFLSSLGNLRQRDWEKYRYVYRPAKVIKE